jgi:hypothetical protein
MLHESISDTSLIMNFVVPVALLKKLTLCTLFEFCKEVAWRGEKNLEHPLHMQLCKRDVINYFNKYNNH